ncbi:MAG TPA: PhoU domain-containing protein [Polyangiaceae bacterium]|jgi:phosphate uptake regulator|nr:PhoU domain-containing protein [Polyangiaceae bacterium]
MQEESTASPLSTRSTRALDRLRPVAEHVDAFTRESGRAVVDGDADLALALLSAGGERARCDTAVQAAWSDILGGQSVRSDVAANVSLLVSLEKIADLASIICRSVIGLSTETRLGELPSIRKLAELVPGMLRDALGAVRENDQAGAGRVLHQGLTVDAFFAQAHFDMLNVMRPGGGDMSTTQKFHAMSRALEQISDGASEIAASVGGAAAFST